MTDAQRVAVITGASGGTGAALVNAYRDRNYRVVAMARTLMASSDPDILVIPADITDPKMAERVISEGQARFGRIDTLVNNAGIFIAKPFAQYTELTSRPFSASTVLDFFTSRSERSGQWTRAAGDVSYRFSKPYRPCHRRGPLGPGIVVQGRTQCGDQIACDRVCQARHPSERSCPRTYQDADACRGHSWTACRSAPSRSDG